MIFFDTESIGFYGPTVLIQYAKDNEEPTIHNIWQEPVYKTLEVIEYIISDPEGLCGFNLVHDSYHIHKTYNVLKQLPLMSFPNELDYHDVEQEDIAKDSFCVKPIKCLDLLLHGKKNEYQSILNQKDIVIRRVPKILAEELIQELKNKVHIPSIYFSKSKTGYLWRTVELHKNGEEVSPEERSKISKGELENTIDENLVNIKLKFSPSAALKIIVEHITNKKVNTIEDLIKLPKVEETAYYPSYGGWLSVAREHIYAWSTDDLRIKYAKDDVIYTRMVYEHFKKPKAGDVDSELAWGIGGMFYRGFTIDRKRTEEQLEEAKKKSLVIGVNVNAPKQVLNWLRESATDIEKVMLIDTSKDTLKNILDSIENQELIDKINVVFAARRALKEVDLCKKLLRAGRLHASYKIIGTKSNRMAGGSENYISSKGAINPQGIKKDPKVRSMFILYNPMLNEELDGGDFDAFEVTIADAIYNDEGLRQLLIEGKKIHALFAEEIYNIPYEKILAHSEDNENSDTGWYSRGKKGIFAFFYGATAGTIAQHMWVEEEEAIEGIEKLKKRFPGIAIAQNKIYENYVALRQPKGIGTKVEWSEPKTYVESLLGFKRYFTLEYSVIRTLFGIAQKPSDSLKDKGRGIKIKRRDRIQTASGATSSAIYAAAFNLQAQVTRAAANHEIQSTGGEITKGVQFEIWKLQPSGCHRWYVMPMNEHDELETVVHVSKKKEVAQVVSKKVEEYRSIVPLLAIKWKQNLKNWGEK